MTIENIGNSKSIGKIEICHANQKQYQEKTFCMSSNKLYLKYGLQDNHWVGQLVMKLVDSVAFKEKVNKIGRQQER